MLASVLLTGFVGLGNILAGRANLLPSTRLPLTLRGCPCANETGFEVASCSDFLAPEEYDQLDLPDTANWKDKEYSGFIKIWSTSFSEWQNTL